MPASSYAVLKSYNYNFGTIPNSPVAEQNQTYMAFFEGVGGTGPELLDQTSYIIKYLIDTEGNVTNPSSVINPTDPLSVPLYNLLDNFEPGKRAAVRLIGTDPLETSNPNDDALTGIHTISHVGRVSPILVTETGSGKLDYIRTMSFGLLETDVIIGNPLLYIPDLNFAIKYQGPPDEVDISNTGTQFNNNIVTTPNQAWDWTSATLTALSSSVETGTSIRFKITAWIEQVGDQSFDVAFGYSKNGGAIVWSSWIDFNGSAYYTHTTSYINNYFPGDYFRFYCKSTNGVIIDPETGFFVSKMVYRGATDTAGTVITVQQQTPAGVQGAVTTQDVALINGVNALYNPFFVGVANNTADPLNSSNRCNSSILFLSDSASAVFNSNRVQNLDSASALIGFSPITIPFGNTQPGDFIRFEHVKDQIYNIVEIIYDYQPNPFAPYYPIGLKIVPELTNITASPGTIELNHFVIYRIVNDGSGVILNVPKPVAGSSFTGIIMPEFSSDRLENNYDKIIADLTNKEIIN
jgi:hypothetical protein